MKKSNFSEHSAPQGTPEWLAARIGRLTGSRAVDMLASIKSGEAAARRDYRYQLATERLTGVPQNGCYVNADMQWGTEQEPFARMAYEVATGNLVRQSGFLAHNAYMAGCSLDGDINDFEGILEIKCPKSATHIGYLDDDRVPARYLSQITHNLWITCAKWCDFVSFDPRMPDGLQLFIVRHHADNDAMRDYEDMALAFLAETEELTKRLTERLTVRNADMRCMPNKN